jgi:N-acetylglucosamine kinase-like BadF-type ATPase
MTTNARPADGTLALDAGQTGIKVRYTDAAGAQTAWSLPGVRTDIPLLPQLGQVLQDAAHRAIGASRVGIGVSGLTEAETRPEVLLTSAQALGARELVLAHDSVTAYLAALDHARGVVVAAGTGAVTFAVGRYEVARVDGWGNLMGDAGSGYWIGREALDAVMRQHDGRGPATELTARVQQDFPRLDSAYIELQGDPQRVGRIAAYAEAVTALADSDPVAADIVDRAAAQLALAAATALRRVGEDSCPKPTVRAVGGVFKAACVFEAFERRLGAQFAAIDVRRTHTDALDGAERLLGLPAHSPLLALLHPARA